YPGTGLQHVEGETGLIAHARGIPWRIEDDGGLGRADALYLAGGILHPARHFARHRAGTGRQGHLDLDMAVVVDVDLVDQAQLVDVDRDFRVIDFLKFLDQVVGDLVQLVLRDGRRLRLALGRRGSIRHLMLQVVSHFALYDSIFRALESA